MRNMAEGIGLGFLALLAMWGAWQVPGASPGDTWAGIVPFAASLGLLGLSGFLVASATRANATGSTGDDREESAILDILVLFVVALIYQQSFRWFGYVLPTAIAAPIVMYLFGVRSWVGLAASIVLCPLVFHILFFVLLGVFPPFGEVFDLLDWFRG